MYNYANVDTNSQIVISFSVENNLLDPEEYFDSYLVDAVDETWIQRKRYDKATQTFVDVLPSQAIAHNSLEYTHIDTNGVKHWLDEYVEKLATRRACTYAAKEDTAITTAGALTTMPLETAVVNVGAGFTITADGGVRVEATGTVMISGGVYVNDTSATKVGCFAVIKRNGTTTHQVCNYGPNGVGITSGMKVVPVEQGDIIYLQGRIIGGTGTMRKNESTFLSVAYI